MPSKQLNPTQYGDWTILSEAPRQNRKRCFHVRCTCGTEAIVREDSLKSGRSTSCPNCSYRQRKVSKTVDLNSSKPKSKRTLREADRRLKHGLTRRSVSQDDAGYRTYVVYRGMLKRVAEGYPPDAPINIDPRWQESIDAFVADMGWRPARLTLDRIDNGRGYWKDNCRWGDGKLQAANRRSTKPLTIGRTTLSRSGWQELLGISRHVFDRMTARQRFDTVIQLHPHLVYGQEVTAEELDSAESWFDAIADPGPEFL